MTTSPQSTHPQTPEGGRSEAEELIDQEAATIDARSPDAPKQIAELEDEADELGLPTPEPDEVDAPTSGKR